MKLLKSILLTGVLYLPLYSQVTFPARLGPDNDQHTKILKVLGKSGPSIFYMAAKNEDLYVQRYDQESLFMQINNEIEIPKKDGVKLDLAEMFLLNNQILLFATGYSAEKIAYVTYSFIIDNECKLASDGNLVLTMPVEKKIRSGQVTYQQSSDRSRILIFNKTYFAKEELHRYAFILLNEQGEKITEQGFDVEEGEGREIVSVKSFALDQKNNIHCVISRSLYDRSTKEKNERFEVVSYRESNNYKSLSTELKLEANKAISSVIIAARNDGGISIGGLYISLNGKRAMGIGIEGCFYTAIDSSGSASNVYTVPFTDEFKRNFISGTEVDKGTDLPMTYSVKDVFINEQNEIILIAENHYVYQGIYFYGPVIIIKMTARGTVLWEQYVDKQQFFQERKVGVSTSSGPNFLYKNGAPIFGIDMWIIVTSNKETYLSYKVWETNHGLVFLFNDSKDNIEKVPEERRGYMNMPLKSIPFSATVTHDGAITYRYEEQLGDEETVMRPRMAVIQDNILLFVSSKRVIEKVGAAQLIR